MFFVSLDFLVVFFCIFGLFGSFFCIFGLFGVFFCIFGLFGFKNSCFQFGTNPVWSLFVQEVEKTLKRDGDQFLASVEDEVFEIMGGCGLL